MWTIHYPLDLLQFPFTTRQNSIIFLSYFSRLLQPAAVGGPAGRGGGEEAGAAAERGGARVGGRAHRAAAAPGRRRLGDQAARRQAGGRRRLRAPLRPLLFWRVSTHFLCSTNSGIYCSHSRLVLIRTSFNHFYQI